MEPTDTTPANKLRFAEGELLFAEGDVSTTAYFLETGHAEVFKTVDGEEVQIATIGPGDLVGEMALINAEPRSASVRFTEAATVTRLTEESLVTRLNDADPLVQLVLCMSMDRLRAQLQKLGNGGATAAARPATIRDSVVERLRNSAIDRARIEHDLKAGFETGELCMHYQPIVDLLTMQPVGMEALLRWERPGQGTIGPDRFITIAEQTDLIIPIGRWAFEQACRQVHQCAAMDGLYVSINVATRQFDNDDVADVVRCAIQNSGIAPERVRVELTETAMMTSADRTAEALAGVRACGASAAIDDFGTGYSSLSYLINLQVDAIKIDRAFVLGMRARVGGARVIRAIASLGRELGLQVVVEGAEEMREAERLRDLGCDYVQGYCFTRPLPLEEMAAWLTAIKQQKHSAVSP